MGPICCVLMVNCIVFVMVTRVVCGRRPRSHKPRSPSTTPSKESPITLAQVRGAVTVVALLGVTWVAGAVSVGWARITLQYIFCVTTPLQGVIIFVVRVAQHPEARAAWITLFTTGTLRRRPPTTHTHSTHSSAHTSSSALTPPRNNHSSLRSISTKISPRTSVKRPSSVKRNGSTAYSKNGSDHRYSMGTSRTTMSTLFSRLVHCFSNSGLELDKTRPQEEIVINSPTKPVPTEATPPQRHASSPRQESFFSETLQEKSLHSNKNGTLYRPQSLIMLRPENRGFVSVNQPSNSKDCNVDQFPGFLSSNIMSQDLPEAATPQSLIPGRSLGSLMLLTEGKEGDDSSWHFVRPPPDGRSDPVNEEEEKVLEATDQIIPLAHVEHKDSMNPVIESVRTEAALRSGDCVVLAGQRVATKHSIMFSGQGKGSQWAGTLIRANSEGQVGSPHISPSDLRRSASVFTLGEWEDPRSSLA
ncbi:Adhesion G protein-coupled receptor L2-like [Homarus americanus]|uniref:Adhesion G protein-coupled receptor L2-like n=2 Tax=Homarus americanus TaxID=6706 RepID=A0A8J5JNU7_HOMAM|nr:Adhesion G protein-coupled receptor L2-like [Homarus americanus]